MLDNLLSSIIFFLNSSTTEDFAFSTMCESTSNEKTEVIEMDDFSDEARQKRIDSQIRKASKKLIPSTEMVNGTSNHYLEPVSYTYYNFVLTMGKIQLIRHETPPQSGYFFIVRSENESKLIAQANACSFRSRIVSVELRRLNQEPDLEDESDESFIAGEILNKARLILEEVAIKSDLDANEIELKDIRNKNEHQQFD